MSSVVHIDGVDVKSAYGIVVAREGYNELVAFAKMKDVDYNDWPEEDGIEPDLMNPVLSSHEFDLELVSTSLADTVEFFDLITDGAYHNWTFDDLGITLSLRLVSQPSYDEFSELQLFSLKLSLDVSQLAGYTYSAPTSGRPETGDKIDDIDVSTYGLIFLLGTNAEVTKTPEIKPAQNYESKYETGKHYDGQNVCYKSKDIVLHLLMRTDTLSAFWRNWKALLYNLIKTGEDNEATRELLYNSESYNFYYKSCQTKEFSISQNGSVWWKFDLTICMYDYRAESCNILSTENGELITTEDDYLIEL